MGQAVDYLVQLGHRSIVHVDAGSGPMASPRRHGYRSAMTRHGLANQIRVVSGDFAEDGGVRAARELLAGAVLPTGAIAANGRSAIGILDTMVRARDAGAR
ncbi:MAG: substrate-binding domain-containing protein [Nakamurella sp.]